MWGGSQKAVPRYNWEVATQPNIEERLMSGKRGKGKPRPTQQRFAECLRDFLSPALFRQVYRLYPDKKKRRWMLQPLLSVLLCMTWCLGDSPPERFVMARAFFVACHDKRRRPGETFGGFQKALEALPTPVLRLVADLFRKHIATRFHSLLFTDGWVLLGCDGSRLATPRTDELEQRLGDPGGHSSKATTAPQVWLTAFVHLASGLPWSWTVGKGDASERTHLLRLIATLPVCALVLSDAGYQAYLLACQLAVQHHFLMRVSTQTIFYVADTELETAGEHRQVTAAALDKWSDGEVYYWPSEAQKNSAPPLKARLIRIRAKKKKNDVWLITNVLDQERLSVALAGKYYRMRWENEGYFRTYKQTLKKVKLSGRTVASVHREVLGSMLAVQLLLAQGLAAAVALSNHKVASSARQLLLLVREEMLAALRGKSVRGFLKKAAACQREERQRSSAKQKRPWPGRLPPKPIAAPRIRVLSDASKALLHQLLSDAA
jgi:Transposase DDE domain